MASSVPAANYKERLLSRMVNEKKMRKATAAALKAKVFNTG